MGSSSAVAYARERRGLDDVLVCERDQLLARDGVPDLTRTEARISTNTSPSPKYLAVSRTP